MEDVRKVKSLRGIFDDAIVASYRIDEGFSLLTSDRDFLPYAHYMGLDLVAEGRA